jgi:hypothetical protein
MKVKRVVVLCVLLSVASLGGAFAADWEIDFSGWDSSSERGREQVPVQEDVSFIGGALEVTAPSNMGYFITEVIHRAGDEQWGTFSIGVETNDATQRFQVDFLDEENRILEGRTNVRLSSGLSYDLSEAAWAGFRVRVWLFSSLLPGGGSPRVVSLRVARVASSEYTAGEFIFFPNPLAAEKGARGRFRFAVEGSADVTLRIADTGGKTIRVLVDGVSTSQLTSSRAGVYEAEWDGTPEGSTAIVANGTYFCTLVISRARGGEETRFFKVAVIR